MSANYQTVQEAVSAINDLDSLITWAGFFNCSSHPAVVGRMEYLQTRVSTNVITTQPSPTGGIGDINSPFPLLVLDESEIVSGNDIRVNESGDISALLDSAEDTPLPIFEGVSTSTQSEGAQDVMWCGGIGHDVTNDVSEANETMGGGDQSTVGVEFDSQGYNIDALFDISLGGLDGSGCVTRDGTVIGGETPPHDIDMGTVVESVLRGIDFTEFDTSVTEGMGPNSQTTVEGEGVTWDDSEGHDVQAAIAVADTMADIDIKEFDTSLSMADDSQTELWDESEGQDVETLASIMAELDQSFGMGLDGDTPHGVTHNDKSFGTGCNTEQGGDCTLGDLLEILGLSR